MSAHTLLRATSGTDSGVRMRLSRPPDRAKLAVTANRPPTAPNTSANTPASGFPDNRATCCVAINRLLAADNSARGTSTVTYDRAATSTNTDSTPTSSAAPSRYPNDIPPSHPTTGTDASTTARPKLPKTCTGRRRTRSTNTPTGSPTTRNAAMPDAVSSATANSDTPISTATSGNANTDTALPNWLTVSLPQNNRKSRTNPPR